MKVVDTFQFSEPFEADQLFIKLNLEDALVSEWLICENAYTTRGVHKGHFVSKVLEQPRFEPFLDRIKVFEVDHQGTVIGEHASGNQDGVTIANERHQRNASRAYIREHYGEGDRILLSDADECFDFTTEAARQRFVAAAKTSGIYHARRRRFWFDIDNLWSEVRATPAIPYAMLAADPELDFVDTRYQNCSPGDVREDVTSVFEYSAAFPLESIIAKYNSFIHTGYTEQEIRDALACNHLPVAASRGGALSVDEKWWPERIDLEEFGAPQWVRDNADRLRTGVIPDDYRENRRARYPEYFSDDLLSRASVNQVGHKLAQGLRRIKRKLR